MSEPRPYVSPAAAILCGGRGTRLGDTLGGLPKPMAPIGGRPLLERLVQWALDAGSPHVILCAGYGASVIRQHFSGAVWTGRVEISEEPRPLGTGGALRLALPRLASNPVLVLNGDSYLPGFDPAPFFAHHRTHCREQPGIASSLVLTPGDDRTDAGNVALDAVSGRITSFMEKTPAEKTALPGSRYVNAGIYLLDRSLLENIPTDRPVSLERELLPAWIALGLSGYVHRGRLVDIGTPERLAAAQRDADNPKWP